MRASAFGRLLLGAAGILLLVNATTGRWLPPPDGATAAWMIAGAALALFAAVSGHPGTSLPASVVAGTAWVPALIDAGALDDPDVLRLVVGVAGLGVILVVGSIAMQRSTPSS